MFLESAGPRNAVYTDVVVEWVGKGKGDLLEKLRTRSRAREDCRVELVPLVK